MTTGYADGEYPAEIQEIFNELEQALAGAVGPAAGMILYDYIEQWQQNGPVLATRII